MGAVQEFIARLDGLVKELKRANDLAERKLQLEHPDLDVRTNKRIGSPKILSIEHPTVDTWNKKYREQHPQAEDADA